MRYIIIPLLIGLYLFWTIKSIIALKQREDEEYAYLWGFVHTVVLIVLFILACVKFW